MLFCLLSPWYEICRPPDPCEYHDLSKSMPGQLAKLIARLRDYQATAVPKDFHKLAGANCTDPDPSKHPQWNNSWMPFCDAA